MSEDIRLLLDTSEKINSRIVSLTRCLILVLLAYFLDGVQYREIRASLNISDGKLIANLNQLKTMRYIEKIEAEINDKKLDIYTLTEEGKKELNKVLKWMDLMKMTTKEENEKCQATLIK